MAKPTVGIVGIGTYLPAKKMTAKEISEKTNGVWSEEAVISKLGIVEKYIPGEDDGTHLFHIDFVLGTFFNQLFDLNDIFNKVTSCENQVFVSFFGNHN